MISKVVLGTSSQFGISLEEQIRLFKKTGFDGFFTAHDDNIAQARQLADELGLIYQSIHAPFGKMAEIWHGSDFSAQEAVNELLRCVENCAEYNVHILVLHAFIGFDRHEPNKEGLNRLKPLITRAEELNVKLAFENTEGEEYLSAIINGFSDYSCVGFCWDTGHEMCYNRSNDMLSLYGNKLIATHLNDNLGISDSSGNITWLDDLHLLPFDGAADWSEIVKRLNRHNYTGCLTFELNTMSKPDRHENDKYAEMPIDAYIKEAYERAQKIADMKETHKLS